MVLKHSAFISGVKFKGFVNHWQLWSFSCLIIRCANAKWQQQLCTVVLRFMSPNFLFFLTSICVVIRFRLPFFCYQLLHKSRDDKGLIDGT